MANYICRSGLFSLALCWRLVTLYTKENDNTAYCYYCAACSSRSCDGHILQPPLWTRERQQRDVQKIVDTANAIYDKFVNFTDNFTKIDVALKKADEAYREAFKQLATGKGNITKRLSELKEQGLLSTTKQIPEGYIEADNG